MSWLTVGVKIHGSGVVDHVTVTVVDKLGKRSQCRVSRRSLAEEARDEVAMIHGSGMQARSPLNLSPFVDGAPPVL